MPTRQSTLGGRVADLRSARGLTQRRCAQAAGISVTFLSEVENDHRKPGTDALVGLARALDTTIDHLVTGGDQAPHGSDAMAILRRADTEVARAEHNRRVARTFVADLLRLRRVARGESLRETARQLGISAAMLSDLELGRRWSDPIVRRLAERFDA